MTRIHALLSAAIMLLGTTVALADKLTATLDDQVVPDELLGHSPIVAALDRSPCDTDLSWSANLPQPGSDPFAQGTRGNGLTPVEFGSIVYDSNQGVCWLADANLAGLPDVRAVVPLSNANPDGSVPVINPDGTMDWQTALNWVAALNSYNDGKGWLNHNNWQLPINPLVDLSCSSNNNGNFGIQCTGGALSNLYYVGLAQKYPDSVVPWFVSFVWPFLNLQPGLYWAADTSPNGDGGQNTFSFNIGVWGSNTTKYNFLHVLPMSQTALSPIPAGRGVQPYLSGPGAGKAVYDSYTGLSWTLNANLPAIENFNVTGSITITADQRQANGNSVTVPLVDRDGAVILSATVPMTPCLVGGKTMTTGVTSDWLIAMNAGDYAGTSTWQLPCLSDLEQLATDMNLTAGDGLIAGDPRLEWPFSTGPFQRLQPGFYWACVPAVVGSNAGCDYEESAPGINLEWSFNFDDGFEGSDRPSKQFYVMVYFPAP
jgi:hypothetical protein